MFGISARGLRTGGFVAAACMMVAGCAGGGPPGGLPDTRPDPLPEARSLEPAEGEVVGEGETRVALLLPLSGEDDSARVAAQFRNAAMMAMDAGARERLELVIKDTEGTREGTAAAAEEADGEDAAAILGPVFADNVRAAARVLDPGETPLIAFSSDRSVAGPGVYLNSFLPDGVVARTLSYAVENGHRNVAAILPEGQAGDLIEEQMNRSLPQAGGTVVVAERYAYDNASVQAAVQAIAEPMDEADALFIPDGGNSPNAIVSALSGIGVQLDDTKLLGTGQWTTSDLSDSALDGAWFADTDHERLERFRTSYEDEFDDRPSANAALAYDTIVLAANIAGRHGADGFRPEVIESPSGFAGYTGVFRFLADGTAERGLAVYEVEEGDTRAISPAPTRFGAGS